MKDSEIVKALECCVKVGYPFGCDDCPYCSLDCNEHLDADALYLITRLQTENERLEKEAFTYKIRWAKAEVRETKAKSEAYKEFAERFVTALVDTYDLKSIQIENIEKIKNNLLKELVGEDNAKEKE